MPQFDIGNTIEFRHKGQQITGRVVGREPAGDRRGYREGTLLTVRTESGEWVTVHERDVRQEQAS